MRNATNGIVAADYWNIAVAYYKMGQPSDSVLKYLFNAQRIDESSFCELVYQDGKHKNGMENTSFYKGLGDGYKYIVENCKGKLSNEAFPDPVQYARKNGYDVDLIVKLNNIRGADQKYRAPSFIPDKQKPLDEQNIKEIETIIHQYNYPGRTQVGKEYESIAWLVIQHAALEYQEKYLPVIYDAVVKKELDSAPLKMLIDRIYVGKKIGQIFGSQLGAGFANEEIIAKVRLEYNLPY
ncbi:MAG TPA: DUF6624 domain-containing protein [Ohtaekwangia sp.]|uniref:DUF6624 domain-containing protein n=1 Tax=Ohtaekwangia sp. TaxID=2066019 RepID=UPI002F932D39